MRVKDADAEILFEMWMGLPRKRKLYIELGGRDGRIEEGLGPSLRCPGIGSWVEKRSWQQSL